MGSAIHYQLGTTAHPISGLTTQCKALDSVSITGIVRQGIEYRQDASIQQTEIDSEAGIRDELLKRFELTS